MRQIPKTFIRTHTRIHTHRQVQYTANTFFFLLSLFLFLSHSSHTLAHSFTGDMWRLKCCRIFFNTQLLLSLSVSASFSLSSLPPATIMHIWHVFIWYCFIYDFLLLLLLPPGSLQIYDLTHYHKQSESERTQRGNEATAAPEHTTHNTLVMWQHLIMPQKLKFMRRHQPLLPYSLSSDKFMDWLCPLHAILVFHLPLLFYSSSPCAHLPVLGTWPKL